MTSVDDGGVVNVRSDCSENSWVRCVGWGWLDFLTDGVSECGFVSLCLVIVVGGSTVLAALQRGFDWAVFYGVSLWEWVGCISWFWLFIYLVICTW